MVGAPPSELPEFDGLRSRLEALSDGPSRTVRFDRFMEVALYDPEFGYHSREASRLGPGGDFFTAAHLRPLFARTVAARILQEFDRLGRPNRFRVVEAGAGDGVLGSDLVSELGPALQPSERLTYAIVERSEHRREMAYERLTKVQSGHPRIEIRAAEGIGSDGPFEGVVLANELLDAQPCRRFVWRSGAWKELAVRIGSERLEWEERMPAGPLTAEGLTAGATEGQIVEVSAYAEALVREIGDHLSRGSAFLLDYGSDEADLRASRPRGTLTAIRGHRVIDDVLADPGSQDLSTFVNFTRIRQAARVSGLVERSYDRQAEALGQWGLPQVLERSLSGVSTAEEVRLRLQAKRLMFDFENFRVLELGAGSGATP